MRLRYTVKADGNVQQVGLLITDVRGDVHDVEEGRTCSPSTTEAARPAQISVTTIPDLCISNCSLTQVAAKSNGHGQTARGCMVFCVVQHVELRWMRAANQRVAMLCASLRCSFYHMFLMVNCELCSLCWLHCVVMLNCNALPL
jgi:hypothetical protein